MIAFYSCVWLIFFADCEELQKDVCSRLLFTYRKGFGAIGDYFMVYCYCSKIEVVVLSF